MTDSYYLPSEAEERPLVDESMRELTVLLLDSSGSMNEPVALGSEKGVGRAEVRAAHRRKIDDLNSAVEAFLSTEIHAIPGMDRHGELAIAAFGGSGIRWLELGQQSNHPFHYVQSVHGFDKLLPSGTTPLAQALEEALAQIQSRKKEMAAAGIIHGHRPNVFLLTDGKPSDSWQQLPSLIRDQEAQKKILLWVLGTGDADETILRQIAAPNAYYSVGAVSMAEVMKFVSTSLKTVEAMPGNQEASAYYDRVRAMARQIIEEHEQRLG